MMPKPLVRHLEAADLRRLQSHSRGVLAQMQAENLGIHGPFWIHTPQPTLLAGLWAWFRETQLASGVPRADLETLALRIAESNRCPWCVEAHQVALSSSAVQPVVDQWYQNHSNPLEATAQGINPQNMVAYRSAVMLWNYINRMANVFLVDSAWQNFGELRKPILPLLGRVFATWVLPRSYVPGRSLQFIESLPLPKHLTWAAPKPAIAQTLAYFHHSVNALAAPLIPPEVRQLILEFASPRFGQTMGLSSQWADQAVREHVADQRPLAKFLLLVALASFQISDDLVTQVKCLYRSDSDLIAITAWGAYAPFNQVHTVTASRY